MAACECKSTARRLVKCDAHLMEEMRGLGLDPVSCGYRHNGRQNVRVVSVRCPGCEEVRDIFPGNARMGRGIRCTKCAGLARVGQPRRDPVKTCACGTTYSTHSLQCDECIVEEMCDLGHDAISIVRSKRIVYAVCRCSVCGEKKSARVDDLKRPRVRRPWRCGECGMRHKT